MRTETVAEMLARLRAAQERQAHVILLRAGVGPWLSSGGRPSRAVLTPGQLPPAAGDVLRLDALSAVRVTRVRGRRVWIESVVRRRGPLGGCRWEILPPARPGGPERLRRVRGMGAIGAVEDALGSAEDTRAELDNAADVAEGEGHRSVASDLRALREKQDAIAATLSAVREELR